MLCARLLHISKGICIRPPYPQSCAVGQRRISSLTAYGSLMKKIRNKQTKLQQNIFLASKRISSCNFPFVNMTRIGCVRRHGLRTKSNCRNASTKGLFISPIHPTKHKAWIKKSVKPQVDSTLRRGIPIHQVNVEMRKIAFNNKREQWSKRLTSKTSSNSPDKIQNVRPNGAGTASPGRTSTPKVQPNSKLVVFESTSLKDLKRKISEKNSNLKTENTDLSVLRFPKIKRFKSNTDTELETSDSNSAESKRKSIPSPYFYIQDFLNNKSLRGTFTHPSSIKVNRIDSQSKDIAPVVVNDGNPVTSSPSPRLITPWKKEETSNRLKEETVRRKIDSLLPYFKDRSDLDGILHPIATKINDETNESDIKYKSVTCPSPVLNKYSFSTLYKKEHPQQDSHLWPVEVSLIKTSNLSPINVKKSWRSSEQLFSDGIRRQEMNLKPIREILTSKDDGSKQKNVTKTETSNENTSSKSTNNDWIKLTQKFKPCSDHQRSNLSFWSVVKRMEALKSNSSEDLKRLKVPDHYKPNIFLNKSKAGSKSYFSTLKIERTQQLLNVVSNLSHSVNQVTRLESKNNFKSPLNSGDPEDFITRPETSFETPTRKDEATGQKNDTIFKQRNEQDQIPLYESVSNNNTLSSEAASLSSKTENNNETVPTITSDDNSTPVSNNARPNEVRSDRTPGESDYWYQSSYEDPRGFKKIPSASQSEGMNNLQHKFGVERSNATDDNSFSYAPINNYYYKLAFKEMQPSNDISKAEALGNELTNSSLKSEMNTTNVSSTAGNESVQTPKVDVPVQDTTEKENHRTDHQISDIPRVEVVSPVAVNTNIISNPSNTDVQGNKKLSDFKPEINAQNDSFKEEVNRNEPKTGSSSDNAYVTYIVRKHSKEEDDQNSVNPKAEVISPPAEYAISEAPKVEFREIQPINQTSNSEINRSSKVEAYSSGIPTENYAPNTPHYPYREEAHRREVNTTELVSEISGIVHVANSLREEAYKSQIPVNDIPKAEPTSEISKGESVYPINSPRISYKEEFRNVQPINQTFNSEIKRSSKVEAYSSGIPTEDYAPNAPHYPYREEVYRRDMSQPLEGNTTELANGISGKAYSANPSIEEAYKSEIPVNDTPKAEPASGISVYPTNSPRISYKEEVRRNDLPLSGTRKTQMYGNELTNGISEEEVYAPSSVHNYHKEDNYRSGRPVSGTSKEAVYRNEPTNEISKQEAYYQPKAAHNSRKEEIYRSLPPEISTIKSEFHKIEPTHEISRSKMYAKNSGPNSHNEELRTLRPYDRNVQPNELPKWYESEPVVSNNKTHGLSRNVKDHYDDRTSSSLVKGSYDQPHNERDLLKDDPKNDKVPCRKTLRNSYYHLGKAVVGLEKVLKDMDGKNDKNDESEYGYQLKSKSVKYNPDEFVTKKYTVVKPYLGSNFNKELPPIIQNRDEYYKEKKLPSYLNNFSRTSQDDMNYKQRESPAKNYNNFHRSLPIGKNRTLPIGRNAPDKTNFYVNNNSGMKVHGEQETRVNEIKPDKPKVSIPVLNTVYKYEKQSPSIIRDSVNTDKKKDPVDNVIKEIKQPEPVQKVQKSPIVETQRVPEEVKEDTKVDHNRRYYEWYDYFRNLYISATSQQRLPTLSENEKSLYQEYYSKPNSTGAIDTIQPNLVKDSDPYEWERRKDLSTKASNAYDYFKKLYFSEATSHPTFALMSDKEKAVHQEYYSKLSSTGAIDTIQPNLVKNSNPYEWERIKALRSSASSQTFSAKYKRENQTNNFWIEPSSNALPEHNVNMDSYQMKNESVNHHNNKTFPQCVNDDWKQRYPSTYINEEAPMSVNFGSNGSLEKYTKPATAISTILDLPKSLSNYFQKLVSRKGSKPIDEFNQPNKEEEVDPVMTSSQTHQDSFKSRGTSTNNCNACQKISRISSNLQSGVPFLRSMKTNFNYDVRKGYNNVDLSRAEFEKDEHPKERYEAEVIKRNFSAKKAQVPTVASVRSMICERARDNVYPYKVTQTDSAVSQQKYSSDKTKTKVSTSDNVEKNQTKQRIQSKVKSDEPPKKSLSKTVINTIKNTLSPKKPSSKVENKLKKTQNDQIKAENSNSKKPAANKLDKDPSAKETLSNNFSGLSKHKNPYKSFSDLYH